MIPEEKPKKPRKKNIKPPVGAHKIVFPEDTIIEHQWYYNGSPLLEIPENIIGFIYCITNKITGRKYIGKKNFFGIKTRSIKKQKYRERCQSDFITYYGSNLQLNKDVIEFGCHQFHREILLLCETKSQMSYFETKYQFQYDVIGNPDKWYNEWLTCKITSKHMKPHLFEHEIRNDL